MPSSIRRCWVGVLEKAARFVGGPSASLFSKDAINKSGNLAYGYGLDPHYTQLYFDEYVKLDPVTTGNRLRGDRRADHDRGFHSLR